MEGPLRKGPTGDQSWLLRQQSKRRSSYFLLLSALVILVGLFSGFTSSNALWTLLEGITTTTSSGSEREQQQVTEDWRPLRNTRNRSFVEAVIKELSAESESNLRQSPTRFTTPGRYFEKTPVYIWGGRLTRSIHLPGALFFDFWIHSTDFLHSTWVAIDKSFARFNQTDGLLNVTQTVGLRFWLKPEISKGRESFGQRNVSCSAITNENIDVLAGYSLRRFRCNLTASEGTAEKNHESPLRFQLVNEAEESVTFEVSQHNDTVGAGGPENALPIAFRERRPVQFSLCVGGISRPGIKFLSEFVRHHLRIGVDNIVLSLHGSPGVKEGAAWNADMEETYRIVRKTFRGLIETGTISLARMVLPRDFTFVHRDILKMLAYEQCLFHAKGFSEYVGNWDIDEFFMPASRFLEPPRRTASTSLEMSPIQRVLQAVEPNAKCPDWCYMTFPSYSIFVPPEKRAPDSEAIGSIAQTFPVRSSTAPNYVWQKSMARTKNTFNSGFHVFGSCIFNGTDNGIFHRAYYRDSGCSKRVPELGSIHHFLGIFYGAAVPEDHFDPPFIKDEYSVFESENGNEPLYILAWNGSRVQVSV